MEKKNRKRGNRKVKSKNEETSLKRDRIQAKRMLKEEEGYLQDHTSLEGRKI
jgi:hypothetical protein